MEVDSTSATESLECEILQTKKIEQSSTTAAAGKGIEIQEGSAKIISGSYVFYNPVQEFNRDLSVLVINGYQQLLAEQHAKLLQEKKLPAEQLKEHNTAGVRVLEALAATGLRSIRYAKEITGIREIVANDLSRKAVDSIQKNACHNGVEHIIKTSHADAMSVMYEAARPGQHFDIVDLDPYGCPNRFLDGAVQCISDGGLLLVTATDMAVLAGKMPEACYAKYGSVPLRTKCCHEMALRILLHCIETHANRYGKYIEPLLSISADFYIRLFLRVHVSQAKCKYSMSKQSFVYQCVGCDTFTLQPLGIVKPNPSKNNPNQMKFSIPTGPAVGVHCEHCGQKHHLGGPIWSNPIHDVSFVRKLLQLIEKQPFCKLGTQRRITGILSVVEEELPHVPLYYTLDRLCCVLKLEIVPALKFRSALLHAGYEVSFSHAYKNSIKTNAPADVLWDILRCWSKRHPVKKERMIEGSHILAILSKPCKMEYNFDEIHPLANPKSRKSSLSRFQANPTPFWGPGTRSTIMIGDDKLPKKIRNQNKNQKHKIKTETHEEAAQCQQTESSTQQEQQQLQVENSSTSSSDENEARCKQPKLE